ncbi:single-stranded DNA-binding protein [Nocardioides pakistanensis]
MHETYVTFHGWVGNDVTHRTVEGSNVANMRVGTTPRIKRKGAWVDGPTTWYSVSAWRTLADNVRDSIKKGDAVIVHGRLRSDEWEREDGRVSTTLLVEATFIGHDLCRGTSVFLRSQKRERPENDANDELSEIIHGDVDINVRLDSWGNPVEPAVEPALGSGRLSEELRSDEPAA